jgi:hypothetical protein
VSTNLRTDIAAMIRRVDGTDMSADQFALEVTLGVDTITGPRPHRVDSGELAGFIRGIIPAKDLGADGLADAIVDHFKLDEEN